ncbi:MAG: hypothetical protein H7338_14445 [Candidatus Sericytochromatia bacterium]|nr:hypothetical protein [Candidatus Sericytochromatia bacterium]
MHHGLARRQRLIGAVCIVPFLLAGCVRGGPGVVATGSDLSSGLSDQLNQANELNQTTARNALFQARTAYGNLNGRLNALGKIDSTAFSEVRTTLQPPMLIVANSLAADVTTRADSAGQALEFRQLYSDTLEQMLGGINNNLQIYQSVFESGQALNGAFTAFDATTDDAMASLGRLFEATDAALFFAAELGQFSRLISATETARVMEGIRQQQTTIINGVINFSARGATKAALRQAYNTIVRSITSPSLLPQLQRLAVSTFGTGKVAYKQEQLTPAQPQPNQVVMVIQEAPTQYRFISIDGTKVNNRISIDSRNLSASDLLNQTTVVTVTP